MFSFPNPNKNLPFIKLLILKFWAPFSSAPPPPRIAGAAGAVVTPLISSYPIHEGQDGIYMPSHPIHEGQDGM